MEGPGRWIQRSAGILDLVASLLAGWVVLQTTPIGEIARRGFAEITGARPEVRPLLSYFEQQKAAPLIANLVPPKRDATPMSEATLRGPARGVALLLSGGQRGVTGHFQITWPEAAQREAIARGVPLGGGEAGEAAVKSLLGSLEAELGSEEAAVAALAVGSEAVRYAVNLATSADRPDAARFTGFSMFLRGDLKASAETLVNGSFALAVASELTWPVAIDTPITSPFGMRIHPTLGTKKFHTGIDLAVPTGTAVVAGASGQVRYATEDDVNGKFVKLDHGYGLTTAYCHASSLGVTKGALIAGGTEILRSGATGRATGPHLHFQMEIDRRPIDPELFRPVLQAKSPRPTALPTG